MFWIWSREEAASGGGHLKVMFSKISQKLTRKHFRWILFNNKVANASGA